MLPIIKVYDIDYSFIIKNYLEPEMWHKSWTLFVYKNLSISLSLEYIYCEKNKMSFKLQIIDNNREYKDRGILFSNNTASDSIYFAPAVETVEILKQQINNTIIRLLQRLEEHFARTQQEYKAIQDLQIEEEDRLRNIARDFLDSENVTNDEIRDAYEEWYVEHASETKDLCNRFIAAQQYKLLSEEWYTFARVTNNEKLLQSIERAVNSEELDIIQAKYEEYKKYMESEEYEENQKDKLEDI